MGNVLVIVLQSALLGWYYNTIYVWQNLIAMIM